MNGTQKLKAILRNYIDPRVLGILDYYRFPHARDSWGGPLNGQDKRRDLVLWLFESLPIEAVVETGTYRGTTTDYFSKTCAGPIFSIEADARLYGYSKYRFLFRKNIALLHADSREALRRIERKGALRFKTVLFYLDAHWADDLPLAEELALVFENWPNSVVLIDDFQVPYDAGYGYDDYGPGKALTLQYIQPIVSEYELSVFFPSTPSILETGAKRGCVVVAADPIVSKVLSSSPLLKSYP